MERNDDITSIQELETLLQTTKAQVVKAFLEVRPDLLCNTEFIATEHFEIIKAAYDQHLARIVYNEDIDADAVPVQDVRYMSSGVYFLLDEDKRVVYVGQAVNVLTRIKEHLRNKRFFYVFIKPIDNTDELYLTEDANIHYYNPTFNNQMPFSAYSLLKKILRTNEFIGIQMADTLFVPKVRTRRSYAQLRAARRAMPETSLTRPSRSIIDPLKYQKYLTEKRAKRCTDD